MNAALLLMILATIPAKSQDTPLYPRKTDQNTDMGGINQNFSDLASRSRNKACATPVPQFCPDGTTLTGAYYNKSGATCGGTCTTIPTSFPITNSPIFISSQDVVSVATVTFSIPSSSTTYQFFWNSVSTTAYNMRITVAGNTTAVYSEAAYGGSSGGGGIGNAGTSFRGCDPSGGNLAYQISANGAVEGYVYFSYPIYGGSPTSAKLIGHSYSNALAGNAAAEIPFSCTYSGTATPSTINVTFSQTDALANPDGNNNLVKGHFELWQIGSTHP